MAERRLISQKIVDSGIFYHLSRDAQVLYFLACLYADDEGVVDLYPEIKKLEITSVEPIRELVKGRFIIRLTTDDNLLAYVNRWPSFNKVQPSRFRESDYHELLVKVLPQANSPLPLSEPAGREDADE